MISWDERYGADEYAYGKEPNDFLAEQYRVIPQGRVLCLAEGEGRNAVFLAEQGYEVIAVDSSVEGMKKARQLADEKSVSIETLVVDLNDYDMEPESLDGVVSIFCHLPKPLREKLHSKVVKALKPGGVLLLEAYTPEQLQYGTGGPPVAELTMQLNDLLNEFSELEARYAVEIVREVHEGLYHNGKGAVVQLIAIKQ